MYLILDVLYKDNVRDKNAVWWRLVSYFPWMTLTITQLAVSQVYCPKKECGDGICLTTKCQQLTRDW